MSANRRKSERRTWPESRPACYGAEWSEVAVHYDSAYSKQFLHVVTRVKGSRMWKKKYLYQQPFSSYSPMANNVRKIYRFETPSSPLLSSILCPLAPLFFYNAHCAPLFPRASGRQFSFPKHQKLIASVKGSGVVQTLPLFFSQPTRHQHCRAPTKRIARCHLTPPTLPLK